MKLLVLSDLHVEHAAFMPNPATLAAADAVVLAGDIHTGARAAQWARQTFADKPVILVAGNHEYYDGNWHRTLDDMRELARTHDVHFLENESLTIQGVQFLGTTLWTDFNYFGAEQISQAKAEAKLYMMDYLAIKGCTTPDETIARHQTGLSWLTRELGQETQASARVVVTHHYPHANSTPQKFKSDLCTAAYGSHLPEELITRADLWVHGHTHNSFDYPIGQCRVICNPRGYPLRRPPSTFENSGFNPDLLIEVASNTMA